MAQQFLTLGKVTREAAMILENTLGFIKGLNTSYSKEFAVAGAKVGNVVNVRKPPRYTGTTGQALQLEDVTETSVPVVLTTQFQQSMIFSAADLLLSIDDFAKRIVKPAIASLANNIDLAGTGLYQTVYNTIGTPGTVPNSQATYFSVMQRMSEEACPLADRSGVLTPAMHATLASSLFNIFNPQNAISSQNRTGMIGKNIFGADWYLDQNLRTHQIGPLGGAPAVNGASQIGNSLVTNGWTAAAAKRLSKGDVFTIANVFAVNPQSKQSTNALRQFVVTADVSSDGAGNATIPISPAITLVGPFQTVNALPVTTTALTIFGAANTSTPQGICYHPDAFTFATADLPFFPGLMKGDRVQDDQAGLSIRLIQDYDINLDRVPTRLDLLGGFATIYPELACRIAS